MSQKVYRQADDGTLVPVPMAAEGDISPEQVVAALRHWLNTATSTDLIVLRAQSARALLDVVGGMERHLRAAADVLAAPAPPPGPLGGPIGLVGPDGSPERPQKP